MSVVVARTVYLLGVVLGVATAVDGLTDSSPLEWVIGPAMGLAIWWIAAGIGVRLGVMPADFVLWLRSGARHD